MDDLGLNKVLAAVLATALGVMAVRELPHLLLHSDYPETPAYFVGSLESETDLGTTEPLPFPSPDFVAAMDVERGLKVFNKCKSCHNADNGGAHSTGPNLWNTLGNEGGGKADFKYSSAMSSSGVTWDYESLDGFLTKPAKYLKGTNMLFVGLKKEADRAALIAYLRQQSDTQIALPIAITVEAPTETPEMIEDMGATGSVTAEEVVNQLGDVIEEKGGQAVEKAEEVLEQADGLLDKAKDVVEKTDDAPQ